jgi:hypothetical protein
MLYDLSMSERIVYVIQHIAGSQAGTPKINIIGAQKYGDFKFFITRVFTNDFFSPGPLIYKLRQGLKHFKERRSFIINR